MLKKLFVPLAILIILSLLLTACAPAATPAPTEEAGPTKLKVFGAFATPIEEPWDGVIHQALNKAKDAGTIDYTYTENIGYSGDMERVLREVCEQQKPQSDLRRCLR